MVKRQKQASNKTKTKDFESFLTPKVVAEPKTERGKKIQENKAKRDSLETNLENKYIDPIRKIKLRSRDLAVIIEPELYKNIESAPHRMNNRAVDYMIPHLKLLNTLLANFSEHYKNKIWDSPQFRNLLETYLGTAEYNQKKLSKEEKKARLKSANQWLIDSLKIIEDAIPGVFKQPLKDARRGYFNLLNAICENEGIKDIKIPDSLSVR